MEYSERAHRSDNRGRIYRRQALLGWLFSLAVLALVLFLLFFVWLVPVRVAGDTMRPAFCRDDVLLVDRIAKFIRLPKRGDVILFDDPNGSGALLLRIVALPGETVDLKDGRVYIGGRLLDESDYIDADTAVGDMDALTVPEDAVFVLGDNRALCYDSRTSGIGCVPYDRIIGVVRVRIAPRERIALYP